MSKELLKTRTQIRRELLKTNDSISKKTLTLLKSKDLIRAEDLLQEFVEDIKLAYGTGHGDSLDKISLDWPDLAVTYWKAIRFLRRKDEQCQKQSACPSQLEGH